MKLALLAGVGAMLSACQSGEPASDLSLNSKTAPNTIIASIGKAAQTCWFKSRDAAFATYRLADESNSYAGRPRLLLVPKNNPTGLPSLVIQAEARGNASSGKFSNVQTFGPLLSSPHGKRITQDVERWAKGSQACKA